MNGCWCFALIRYSIQTRSDPFARNSNSLPKPRSSSRVKLSPSTKLNSFELVGRVSSLLCADDLVLKKARDEVSRLSGVSLFTLLRLTSSALQGERNADESTIFELYSDWEVAAEKYIVDEVVDEEEFGDDDADEWESDDLDGQMSISDVLQELELTGVVQMDQGTGYHIRPEELPGLCALYFDQVIRSGLDRTESLPILLFKMLSF